MIIRAGYRITFDSVSPTPINLMVSVHPERRDDLLSDDVCMPSPDCSVSVHADSFGNLVTRVLAPVGPTTFASEFSFETLGKSNLPRPMPVK